MGTNYYVDTAPSCGGKCTQHCRGEEIHLGKSSAGWAFTFRGYPEAPAQTGGPACVTWPVDDYASWHRLLSLGEILDEYGKPWTAEDLLVKIEGKRGGRHHGPGSLAFQDGDGNDFIPREFS